MGALADLWHSERGLLCLVILVAATVLAAVGKIAGTDWLTFVPIIYGIYATAKTVSVAVDNRKEAAAKCAPAVAGATVTGVEVQS